MEEEEMGVPSEGSEAEAVPRPIFADPGASSVPHRPVRAPVQAGPATSAPTALLHVDGPAGEQAAAEADVKAEAGGGSGGDDEAAESGARAAAVTVSAALAPGEDSVAVARAALAVAAEVEVEADAEAGAGEEDVEADDSPMPQRSIILPPSRAAAPPAAPHPRPAHVVSADSLWRPAPVPAADTRPGPVFTDAENLVSVPTAADAAAGLPDMQVAAEASALAVQVKSRESIPATRPPAEPRAPAPASEHEVITLRADALMRAVQAAAEHEGMGVMALAVARGAVERARAEAGAAEVGGVSVPVAGREGVIASRAYADGPDIAHWAPAHRPPVPVSIAGAGAGALGTAMLRRGGGPGAKTGAGGPGKGAGSAKVKAGRGLGGGEKETRRVFVVAADDGHDEDEDRATGRYGSERLRVKQQTHAKCAVSVGIGSQEYVCVYIAPLHTTRTSLTHSFPPNRSAHDKVFERMSQPEGPDGWQKVAAGVNYSRDDVYVLQPDDEVANVRVWTMSASSRIDPRQ
jgi:hypothetical protein